MPGGLFADLKRRRVFRTAAIYAAAAWGVTEASTTVFEKLHFPEWASMLVVIVFLVGFPITVYLSWVFDITSEGIRRTQPLGMRGWSAITLSSFMLVGGTAGLFWLLYEPSPQLDVEQVLEPEAQSLQADTIAVLPFVNAHGNDDEDYFAEGVAETLLAQLSKVENLRVIARDSSFSLRDPAMDVKTKARRLNAAYLLDGSVQRAGGVLRIIVRLVDGESGRYLWSDTLDGGLDEVFQIQDRISESVVAQLEPVTAVLPGGTIQRRFTVNPEAYDHYLRGRFAFNERTPEALEKAAAAFDRAIELDGDFALAYLGRANSLAMASGMNFALGQSEVTDPIRGDWHDYWFPLKVRGAGPELERLIGPDIQRAAELAPGLAETQVASGLLAMRMRRFEQAEGELKRAIELNPNDTLAHHVLGQLLIEIDRYDEATEQLETAIALDPLSPTLHMDLGAAYTYSGQFDRAIAQFETMRDMAPERDSWFVVRYPLYHAGRYLDLVELALDGAQQVREGRLFQPGWDVGFIFWGLETSRLFLGDIEGARRLSPENNDVNYRQELSEQEIEARGEAAVYLANESWASWFLYEWIARDGNFEGAYEYMTEILASVPAGSDVSPMTHSFAGRYALALGQCEPARHHFENAAKVLAPEDWPYSNVHLDFLHAHVDAIDYAIALRCVGEEEQARDLIDGTIAWLDQMEANGYGVSQIPVVRAKAHILRGETDQGLDFLEQYAALPGPILLGIRNDPAFESVQAHPRFRALVAMITEKDRAIIEQIDRAVEDSGLEF